ncbi:hypothetical protein Droror1_Dr00020215 [Drosera rotundifolia]
MEITIDTVKVQSPQRNKKNRAKLSKVPNCRVSAILSRKGEAERAGQTEAETVERRRGRGEEGGEREGRDARLVEAERGRGSATERMGFGFQEGKTRAARERMGFWSGRRGCLGSDTALLGPSLRASDGTDDWGKEEKLASSCSKDLLHDQIKEMKLDVDLLNDNKQQLEYKGDDEQVEVDGQEEDLVEVDIV